MDIRQYSNIRKTYTELEYKLIDSVECLDIDGLERSISDSSLNREVLDDVGVTERPFPLYYILLCYKEINKHVMQFDDAKLDAVLKRLAKEYRHSIEDVEIDYKQYYEDFFCADPEDDVKYLLGATKDYYISRGFKERDIDLYVAVNKFDFEETRRLLNDGADSLVVIEECSAMKRIRDEVHYLAKGLGILGDIIGWAAHLKMERLLWDYAYKVEFEMQNVCWHNKTMVILIGLQASGKSTFFEHYFKEKDFAHVNLDSLHTRNKENELIEKCIEKGQSFVVDNTNPTCVDRKRYMDMIKCKGYKTVCVFMQSILKDCIERNESRDRIVPKVAIAGTSNKLEMPSYAEGFDKIYFAKIDKTEFDWFLIDEWKGE